MATDRIKIILDCDPGHDDAAAILLAGSSPALDVLGITVVAGNQTLEKTVTNALNVTQHLGIDVPVYAGCPGPLVRERTIAEYVHGKSGLDGPVFAPLTKKIEDKHAVQFIIEQVLANPGEVTLVPIGPMTNIALAMRLEPKIVPLIKQIVFMGGSYQLGNTTPAAEFNIFADGEAAHIVFTCGRPMTMVGLDASRLAQTLPSVVDRMAAIGNKASKMFADMMTFFNEAQRKVFGWEGAPLHDPLTIAYLINPAVLTLRPMFSQVDIRSEQSYGRTNCDYFGMLGQEPNMDVAIDVDVPLFWDIIEEGIRRYA